MQPKFGKVFLTSTVCSLLWFDFPRIKSIKDILRILVCSSSSIDEFSSSVRSLFWEHKLVSQSFQLAFSKARTFFLGNLTEPSHFSKHVFLKYVFFLLSNWQTPRISIKSNHGMILGNCHSNHVRIFFVKKVIKQCETLIYIIIHTELY